MCLLSCVTYLLVGPNSMIGKFDIIARLLPISLNKDDIEINLHSQKNMPCPKKVEVIAY